MESLVPEPGPSTLPPCANLALFTDFIAFPITVVTDATTVPIAASMSIHVADERVAVSTALAMATPCAIETSAIASIFANWAIFSLSPAACSNKSERFPAKTERDSPLFCCISTSLSMTACFASKYSWSAASCLARNSASLSSSIRLKLSFSSSFCCSCIRRSSSSLYPFNLASANSLSNRSLSASACFFAVSFSC